MPMRPHLAAALLLCLTTAACSDRTPDAGRARADSARTTAVASASTSPTPGSRAALAPDAAAALDRANAAFRAGRYDAALAAYRAAATRAPDHAAPYYGVYMVARATRNAALADSAMAAIRARTPSDGSLGDSAMAAVHGGGAATKRALPPGHPTVKPKPPAPWHTPVPRTTAQQ
jgi:hypothetical protein